MGDRTGHTVETRALLVLLVQLTARKRYATGLKRAAVTMCSELVRDAFAASGQPMEQHVVFQGRQGPVQCRFAVDSCGVTESLAFLSESRPPLAKRYKRLMESGWHGFRLTSPLIRATMQDILVFCMWSYVHRSDGNIWAEVCGPLFNCVVFLAGMTVERFVIQELAARPPDAAPIMRTMSGHSRRLSRINKLILLRRMRSQRRNRGETMRTHVDLTTKSTNLVAREQTLETCLYVQNLVQAMASTRQVMVAWDASCYDTETLVCCVYDAASGSSDQLRLPSHVGVDPACFQALPASCPCRT